MNIKTTLQASMLALCTMLYGCQTAETPPTFDTAAMDSLLSSAVENGDVIGVSALVFDEGETVYTGAFGLRDRERDQPVQLDTVWRIYSMTKPITSVIIMDLQEEGLLFLDDPASKYIPELANMQVASLGEDGAPIFAPQASPMTIEDLLLHRAGIGYGIFGPINPIETMYAEANLFDPREDLSVKMTKLTGLPLVTQPGEGWYYSYSIDVLGRIIEVVTGQELETAMNERIFEPLGMTETGFHVRADQKPRFASNYMLLEDGSFALQDDGQKSPYLMNPAFESGGGGLVSTLGDYSKFAQMMLQGGIYNGHRVLNEGTVKMMMSDQMDPDDKFLMSWLSPEATNKSFGYGGSVVINTTPEQIETMGQDLGQWEWGGMARTKFWVDPDSSAYGVLMLQFFGGSEPQIHHDFRALAYRETRNPESGKTQ